MKKNLFCFLIASFFAASCSDSGEKDVYPTAIEVTNAVDGKITVEIGSTFQVEAATTPEGFPVEYGNGGSDVFTVTNRGLISAVKVGTGTLTVSTDGQTGKISRTYPVEVKEKLVTAINLTQGTSITLNINQTVDVADRFEVVPADAPDEVEYIVDDTDVARMNGTMLEYVGAGETTLIARALDGSGVESDPITVTCVGAGEMSPKSSWTATASTTIGGYATKDLTEGYTPTPAMAFDGIEKYGWVSEDFKPADYATQWLLIDTKKINEINKISVFDDEEWTLGIEIYLSDKNEAGVTQDDASFSLAATAQISGYYLNTEFQQPQYARYILIKVTKANTNARGTVSRAIIKEIYLN